MATLETLLRRDRALVIAMLVAVTALAWIYILAGAGMNMSSGMVAMSMRMPWTPGYALLVCAMWWVMMVAMMLPSASPVVLLFAKVASSQKQAGKPFVPAGFFLAGYLLAWGGFSLTATGIQWALESRGVVDMMSGSSSRILSGLILTLAGVWQFTPLKQVCLRHCRSPMSFLMHGFRPGVGGALRMGAGHGAYCLGCCWFLMGLLFYGGMMNLYWISGLAFYVLLEKTVPAGHWISYLVGVGLVVFGGWLLVWPAS